MNCGTGWLTEEDLVAITGVRPDTARRWKKKQRVPSCHAAAVQLALRGDLGVLDPRWTGFVLRQGKIWTPESQPVDPGELRAISYRRGLIEELKRQLAEPQQWSLFPKD